MSILSTMYKYSISGLQGLWPCYIVDVITVNEYSFIVVTGSHARQTFSRLWFQ